MNNSKFVWGCFTGCHPIPIEREGVSNYRVSIIYYFYYFYFVSKLTYLIAQYSVVVSC